MSAKKYSSIDNSPTKQCYSFSKAPRFPRIRANTMKFYDIPQKTCKRAPSFGYGIRYDFTPKKMTSPPAPIIVTTTSQPPITPTVQNIPSV